MIARAVFPKLLKKPACLFVPVGASSDERQDNSGSPRFLLLPAKQAAGEETMTLTPFPFLLRAVPISYRIFEPHALTRQQVRRFDLLYCN